MRRTSPTLRAGLALALVIALAALAAPLLAPYDPVAIDPAAVFAPPSAAHWAGTDALGRDVLSRILFGARTSLSAALGIVVIGLAGGAVLGLGAASIGGLVDSAVMRASEIAMALPGLVIALALTAALGPSLVNLVIALGLLAIPSYARIMRGEAVAVRALGYVRAARALGAGPWRIAFTHVAPNLAPMLATYASLGLSGALLATSALSFIGLGAQPPTPEWGAMIYDGSQVLLDAWWVGVFPGIAVAFSALAFTLIGDGLRDWLDPRGAA